jgi:RNA polymerase-binding transcription factor DksA
MKKDQIESFRSQLETLAARVRTDATAIVEQVRTASGGGSNGNLSNVPVHLGDMGTEEFLHEMNAMLLANEEFLAAEARAALRRIDEGAYGTCETAFPADTIAPEGEMEEDRRSRRRSTMDARDRPVVSPDIYAAGTAGGGTAVGGLAGTNDGHGDPSISELQAATASSNFDLDDDRLDPDAPLSGRSGGAVGGTPARKRTR